MKVFIETYRKFDIFFNTENEEFVSESDFFDTTNVKKTYSAIKKSIDTHIANNNNFEPVWVETIKDFYYSRNNLKILLTGIRKDGRFIYQKDGKNVQLAEYDERDYFLSNPDNDAIQNKIKLINGEISNLQDRIKEEEAKLIKVGLSEIKKKYTF